LRPAQRPDRRGQQPEQDERWRGVLWPKQMRFALQLLWHGPADMADDIHALASVFGHLGSLGFRSRRGFGALAFATNSPTPPLALAGALAAFGPSRNDSTAAAPHPDPLPADAGRGIDSSHSERANHSVHTSAMATDSPLPSLARGEGQGEGSRPRSVTESLRSSGRPPIVVRRLDAAAHDWRGATESLLTWLRSWRQHGQMNQRWDPRTNTWILVSDEQRAAQRSQPGFRYARRDHNEGLDVQGTRASYPDPERPMGRKGETFRPALGLPIQQRFSGLAGNDGRPLPRKAATVEWTWENDGRFASPVLLRPHRDAEGNWHALVIFCDSRQWPDDAPVYLNGQPRKVLPVLYEAMKSDSRLQPWP